MLIRKTIFYCLFMALLYMPRAQGQVVWENHTKEIYNYLSRMAQKGLIELNDNIKPLSRKYMADCLDSLAHQKNALTATEQNELLFYAKEYGNEMNALLPSNESIRFLKTDPYQRWRSFSATGKEFILQADPVFSAATISGTGKSVTQSSSGLHLWGNAGKHWGFLFFYNDISESGKGFDSTRQNNDQTGIVRKDTSLHSGQNYSQFRGSISYSWHKGSLSFGQDYLLWGYGENGKIVLSDKAPAFPFIRLDYHPLSWLSFHYSHTWLNSNIIDSNRSYGTGSSVYGGVRQVFVPKFMATHSIQINTGKGLSFALGESIVYSDRLDIGYLMPLMFFKVYDNIVNNSNINTGSNGQLFFQVSSRNQLRKTHLYGTLFIDEIRFSSLFNKTNSRNQLGFTLGGNTTDLLIPYLTVGLEYTRVNPFVYKNLIPAQDYTSFNYALGDWMGNNFDRLSYTIKYTPLPRLKCLACYQTSRKGGAGTLAQQYFQQPQPAFLFNRLNGQEEVLLKISYEWINNLTLMGFYNGLTTKYSQTGMTVKNNTLQIGFTYGL